MTEQIDDLLGVVEKLEGLKEPEKPKKKGKGPCDTCTLNGPEPVPYEGDLETARVMFIGEAPGKQEDEERRPFVGQSGQYLRSAIEEAQIGSEDVIYTNVCKCRPVNNRTPSDKEISRCKKYLQAEIEQFKGGLIVLLGGTPLKAVLGKSGLLNNRGYGFTAHGKHILVTYHPAYVLRNRKTRVEEAFQGDLSKVKAYLDSDFSIDKVIVDNVEDLELMLTELLSWDGQCNLSFDIETTGFDPFEDKVLSIAFSAGDKNWFIPLEHKDSTWNGKSAWVMKQIEVLFTDKKFRLIAQNAKFDIKFLRQQYGIIVSNLWFDTMVAHYLLVGKFIPHTLKGMAWRYTNLGGYEIDRENLADIPLEELARYNVWDTRMTLILQRHFMKKMAGNEQWDLMVDIISPAIQAIAEMELEGVQLDADILEEMLERYIREVTELENNMLKYPVIQEYAKKQNKKFNFGSTKQLREVFEILKIDTGKESKKTGNMSTDEEALTNVKGKHGLVNDLLQFRKKNKVLGTYLKPYVEKQREGRIHADYSFITTDTGRLSSFNPNFQNIPYDTRPVFNSKYGLFLEFDYSQLELRVLAMIANDGPMIEDFRKGVDIHEGTRMYMYGDNSGESDSVKKEQRVQAKAVNFSIVYGTWYKSLAKELNRPEKVAKNWIDTWYRKHPMVKRYQNMVWDHVKQYGYIDTPFGRTRHFNLRRPGLSQTQMNAMFREAINMPIQSTASDIVLAGLGRLWNWMRQEGLRSQMVWEVHDSIGIDCYEDEIEMIILKGKEILEGVSYGWMRDIPLVVDVSVGSHWGKLEELEF